MPTAPTAFKPLSDAPEIDALKAKPLTLSRLRLLRVYLPQKEVFVSGVGTRKGREALLVEWTDQQGRIGWGEFSGRPDPYYSPEYLDATFELIPKFIFPTLENVHCFGDLTPAMHRVRGWDFTKTAIEMAALRVALNNDLEQLPLGDRLDRIPVGISQGIFNDPATLQQKVDTALELGFQRLKFKIAPSLDLKVFEQVQQQLLDADTYVSFDANGTYDPESLDHLAYFVRHFPKATIEQPFAPTRFDHLQIGKAQLPELKICFDEEIVSVGDVIKLHRLGVLDEVNLKPGRVGGFLKSIAIKNYCQQHGIPCWVGGMFETGVGRLFNLHIASALPNARAHDLSPSDRYFPEDLISPAVEMENGFVLRKSLAACEILPERIAKYTTQSMELSY